MSKITSSSCGKGSTQAPMYHDPADRAPSTDNPTPTSLFGRERSVANWAINFSVSEMERILNLYHKIPHTGASTLDEKALFQKMVELESEVPEADRLGLTAVLGMPAGNEGLWAREIFGLGAKAEAGILHLGGLPARKLPPPASAPGAAVTPTLMPTPTPSPAPRPAPASQVAPVPANEPQEAVVTSANICPICLQPQIENPLVDLRIAGKSRKSLGVQSLDHKTIAVCQTCAENRIKSLIDGIQWMKLGDEAPEFRDSQEMIQKLVNHVDVAKYQQYNETLKLPVPPGTTLHWCLSPTCSFGEVRPDAHVSYLACKACGYKSCVKCKVPWHKDKDCEMYQEEQQDRRARVKIPRRVATESKGEGTAKLQVGDGEIDSRESGSDDRDDVMDE